MATSPRKVPSYRLHKPTGQGVVRLDGRDHYLGKHGTPQSHEKYRRIVAEWLTTGSHVAREVASETSGSTLTVGELLLAFWKHAEQHYRAPDGTPSEELGNIKASIRPVRLLYGMTLAKDFGPLPLRAVRDRMIEDGLARPTINARINRVRSMFKWGASLEMLPVATVHALQMVAGLQKGRTTAREPEPVRPVSLADVEKTLPFLTRPIAGMVRLQLLTGMRPGEACVVRGCDLEQGETTWTYRPSSHKTAWRGKTREIIIGPRAQAILAEFAKPEATAYLFSPREAIALNRKERKSEQAAGGKAKRGSVATRDGTRRYHRATYLHAITRACKKANVTPWTPNQLRHTNATEVSARFGLEAAQVILGHARADVTQIYAERNMAKAREVMREIG